MIVEADVIIFHQGIQVAFVHAKEVPRFGRPHCGHLDQETSLVLNERSTKNPDQPDPMAQTVAGRRSNWG